MSQLTAPVTTHRAARLPDHRAVRASAAPRSLRLRVVSGEQVRRSHTGFSVLCALLMTGGLLAVLLLNTARAEQSFAIGGLQQTSDRLSDNEEQLRTDLANVAAPQQLALKAQEMGMAPAQDVRYVRTSDGKVLGVASKAAPDAGFTVGTLPSTPASGVAAKASAASDQGIVVVPPKPPTPPPAPKAPAPSGAAPAPSGRPSSVAPAAPRQQAPTRSPVAEPQATPSAPRPTSTR